MFNSHRLTVKEQIDEALRGEASKPRADLLLTVNQRGWGHVRSYVVDGRYRGAAVILRTEQLEEWKIR